MLNNSARGHKSAVGDIIPIVMIKRLKKYTPAIIALGFLFYIVAVLPILNLKTLALQFPNKVLPVITTLDGSISDRHLEDDYKFLFLEMEYFNEYLLEIDSNAARLEKFSFVPYFGSYLTDLRTFTLLLLTSNNLGLDFATELSNSKISTVSATSKINLIIDLAEILGKKLPRHKKNFETINQRVQQIDTNKYPVTLKGVQTRDLIGQLKFSFNWFVEQYDNFVLLAEDFSDLVGNNGVKQYMVILQNENEEDIYVSFSIENSSAKIYNVGVFNPYVLSNNFDGLVYVKQNFVDFVFDSLETTKQGNLNNEVGTLLTNKFSQLDKKKKIEFVSNGIGLMQSGGLSANFQNAPLQNILEGFGFSKFEAGFWEN